MLALHLALHLCLAPGSPAAATSVEPAPSPPSAGASEPTAAPGPWTPDASPTTLAPGSAAGAGPAVPATSTAGAATGAGPAAAASTPGTTTGTGPAAPVTSTSGTVATSGSATPASASTPAPAKPSEAERFYPPRREHLWLAPGEAGPLSFTPGKGVKVQSKDGRYSFALSLRTGFLYSGRHAPPAPFDHSLEIRRVRLVLSGNVFGKHINYFMQLALAPRELDISDGVVHASPVLDAYVRLNRLRDFNLWVGQYRVMYTRERNIQDINPLLIDRSLANFEFNVDRDIGFDVRSEDLGGIGKLRYYAGVFMGEGKGKTGFTDTGLMYVGRVDVLPFGLFDDYDASDLTRLRRPRLSLGLGYAYNDRAHNNRGVIGQPPADGGTTNYHNFTTDLMFKVAGLSLEATYLWRQGRRNPGGALDDMGNPIPVEAARNGHGWVVQAGFLIPRTGLEPAFRSSGVRAIGDAAKTSMTDRDELGGGLNYYFAGHSLKLQLDYFRTFDRSGKMDPADLVRLQLQIAL